MQFDLTHLSPGEIAILTAFASCIVAVIAATGAFATAWVNGYNARRLEYIKIVQAAKAKQARLLRRVLNTRTRYYLHLTATGRKLSAAEPKPSSEPTILPLFLSSDKYANKLIKVANEQQKLVKKAIDDSAETLSADTIAEIRKLVQILAVLNHFLEVSVLRHTVDPTRYLWRLRLEALNIAKGKYQKIQR